MLFRSYFDTNIPVGGRGNLGFNSFRTDGTTNMNFAVEREFALRPGSDQLPSLQFRAEFYNLLNRSNFGDPNTLLFNSTGQVFATAGQIVQTRGTSRQIQFALRFSF